MIKTSFEIIEDATKRIQELKEASISARQYVCVERARYLTNAYKDNQADPMILRRAKALSSVLSNITLFVEDGQLLAGNHAASLRAAPIFPEYSIEWLIDEIDELDKRPGDRFYVTPEVRRELLEISQWWRGKTVHGRCLRTLPEDVKQAYKIGVISANGNMTSGDGHIMLDFEKILSRGAKGIIKDAQEACDALDLSDPASHHKRIFYTAVVTAYEGVIRYAERYADLASRLAQKEKSIKRRNELLTLSSVCRRVPANPASNFYEAVQTVWFVHLISQIESNGHSMSFGRLDQYLYPFYKKGIEDGTLTESEAIELLCCLWIKAFGVVKIRPWSHTRFSGGGPTYQNLTLGGISPKGEDAVNSLTMACLESIALTRLPQPNVSARYNQKNPDTYLKKCVEVIKMGFGMPAMHSDAMMIPSLMSRGVSEEDANNYAIVGCIEPIVPGKFGYRAAGMSFTNFLKMLETTLNDGHDDKTGLDLYKTDVKLGSYESFSHILDAYRATIAHVVKLRVAGELCIDYAIEELVPDAFCSGLIQDCIMRGKTAKEGGSVYDMVTGPETGIVNAANSLAAIKKLVFEEKRITQEELKLALQYNFNEKYGGENLRQMLLNRAPKFGNDDDYVDEIANLIYTYFIKEQEKYTTTRFGRGPIGCLSYPCTATISANVPSGVCVGASAEGRFDGEPLSEGCSPYHGTDTLGPTAVILSVAKMPNHLITGGNLLNLKFSPSVMQNEAGIQRIMDLIKTFFIMGGWHLQFNIVSTETLREAQANPEAYKDLVVRVAGYSALFNDLERETQDDIIERTEHKI
jgi:pyruvate formate-lyase/glycerol dehydratase family glycyl radical enzyme